MSRIAVLQTRTGIDPDDSVRSLTTAAERASAEGASMLFTPEMSGFLDQERDRAEQAIAREGEDRVLAAMRDEAARHGLWIALGSLAIVKEDGGWANRAFVIDAGGEIAARYDKIHMFDADPQEGESWHESSAYDAGETVVTVDTPAGRLGVTICYDIRFPALFEALGRAKCDLIATPAAFTKATGAAHWHVLQRARAIEASAYVVAAAQVGHHADDRRTYGHSLVIDPWGKTTLDLGGAEPGMGFATIDAERIAEVRDRVPSLANRRDPAIYGQ